MSEDKTVYFGSDEEIEESSKRREKRVNFLKKMEREAKNRRRDEKSEIAEAIELFNKRKRD